jgi:hypothetical protein
MIEDQKIQKIEKIKNIKLISSQKVSPSLLNKKSFYLNENNNMMMAG